MSEMPEHLDADIGAVLSRLSLDRQKVINQSLEAARAKSSTLTVLDSQVMKAHVVDGYGDRIALVSVPMLFDGVLPQVPAAIMVGRRIAIVKDTAPLTYIDYSEPYTASVIESYTGK